MFADTVDSFNVCEMAACHDLHRAPDTPDTLVDGIAFYATSSNSFGIYPKSVIRKSFLSFSNDRH